MDAHRKVELFLERPMRPGRASSTHKGSLIIIGGHEDRTGERKILRAVADRLGDDGKIVVERNRSFQVLGAGAVYVVDGSTVRYSNIGEEDSDRTLSSFGLSVHMMSQGDRFDLVTRTPHAHPADSMEEATEERTGTK